MSSEVPLIHIVDDDETVRSAVGRMMRAAGYQVSLHESANQLLDSLPAPSRGCILLDVRMPGINGPQLQELLDKKGFSLPIIFLTGHGDIPTSVHAIKAGAEDFLSKPASKEILLEAVERALRHYDKTHERNIRLSEYRECYNALTPRERQVFAIVVRGRLNKQIAYELGTSERTIKSHRHNIMQKFKVKSLAELVSIAEHLGRVTEPGSH
ncbi:MAG TPA: response regulator transcription factor [Pseudolabrys sp.]|nr:response regulator transcription factor [Pseudolabrys sp.]